MISAWEISMPLGVASLVYGLGQSGIEGLNMVCIVCGVVIIARAAVAAERWST